MVPNYPKQWTGQPERPSRSDPIPHQREPEKDQGLPRPDPGHDENPTPKPSLGRRTYARRNTKPDI